MDLAYLTGQRPADVLVMRKDDVEGKYLGVQQNKTHKKLRIQMTDGDEANSLGLLIAKMAERNAQHICSYLIVSARGKRMTAKMLRDRWDKAREKGQKKRLTRLATRCWSRKSAASSFVISDQKPRQKSSTSVMRACSWVTPRATSRNAFTAASAPSPSHQNSPKTRYKTQNSPLVECGLQRGRKKTKSTVTKKKSYRPRFLAALNSGLENRRL